MTGPDRSIQDRMILDPRQGDLEDDHSAPFQRSLVAIAGSLLAEISLPKLLLALVISIIVPAVVLGLLPIVVTGSFNTLKAHVYEATGFGLLLAIAAAAWVSWLGWRPLFFAAERNFWTLNALAVQPGYMFWRETLRHLIERILRGRRGQALARLRAGSCLVAGLLLLVVSLAVARLLWPHTVWIGSIADLAHPRLLLVQTLTNAAFLICCYLGPASLAWAILDVLGGQPIDLEAFATGQPAQRSWRIAHLSDVHAVGEQYGFRIESGRSGPCGNGHLRQTLQQLAELHRENPLDLVLVTGDMTDAGTSGEWCEFIEAVAAYPELSERMLLLPGNHDVNIIDRGNPARLTLPFSPAKTLRKMRVLSAMAAIHGRRVHVCGEDGSTIGAQLADLVTEHKSIIARFADRGGLRLSRRALAVWTSVFPLVMPPASEDGLGVILLDSNAESNFSFTNALGMVTSDQSGRLTRALERWPRACWIVALHHHLVEYPTLTASLSDRIATALINGSAFLHALKPHARRLIVMHGHRHIDWIGTCGEVTIVSAPSPVMGRANESRHFHIHSVQRGGDGTVRLLAPQRIDVRSV